MSIFECDIITIAEKAEQIRSHQSDQGAKAPHGNSLAEGACRRMETGAVYPWRFDPAGSHRSSLSISSDKRVRCDRGLFCFGEERNGGNDYESHDQELFD